jgi:hypothetical protein
VDALALSGPHRFGGARDIFPAGARQPGDHRAFHALGYQLHALEIADAGDREAGFQDIHAQFRQRFRHAQFLVDIHGKAGGLFAVPQGGVKNDDAIFWYRAKIRVVDGHGSDPSASKCRCY